MLSESFRIADVVPRPLILPFATLTWLDIATILVISFVGDIAVNQLSYALGIRNTKW